jgi:hypothetical protein
VTDVYLALVHHPVYNKRRQIIAAALTTIDLHDMARLSATYGLKGFFVVTPLEDQIKVAQAMIDHWSEGWGREYNQTRAEALSLVSLAHTIDETKEQIRHNSGAMPIVAGTTAADGSGRTSFDDMRRGLLREDPILLILGTAWGLTDETVAACDIILEPIKGPTRYNHLSVRAAAGIILDRLLGIR